MTTSKQAVFYAHNNKSSGATEHIDINFYIVKEEVQDQTICLEYISTKKMLADLLTKGLPPNVFREHLAVMGLREGLWFLDKEGPRIRLCFKTEKWLWLLIWQ